MQALSDAIRKATDDLLGMALSEQAWEQATLPISQSGLGISDPVREGPQARLAALAGFESFGRERVGVPDVAYRKAAGDLEYVIG